MGRISPTSLHTYLGESLEVVGENHQPKLQMDGAIAAS